MVALPHDSPSPAWRERGLGGEVGLLTNCQLPTANISITARHDANRVVGSEPYTPPSPTTGNHRLLLLSEPGYKHTSDRSRFVCIRHRYVCRTVYCLYAATVWDRLPSHTASGARCSAQTCKYTVP